MKYGIQDLSPKFFGGPPDIAVAVSMQSLNIIHEAQFLYKLICYRDLMSVQIWVSSHNSPVQCKNFYL